MFGRQLDLDDTLKMTPELWSRITHFSPDEFVAPEKMSFFLLCRLDAARSIAGIPFIINSSYREDSPSHKNGVAVNVAASMSTTRYLVVQGAIMADFQRIGVYDLHVHLDVSRDLDQRVIWNGRSR